MDKSEKLSIVIPAYNAEKYIGRCLDSILNQDYHNEVEIIVVNDGSTDSTGNLLNDYSSQFPDLIRIISKENGGVSSARNTGIDAATGEWIWFCDADDYICKNGLSYVLDHFVDNDIEVCSFGGIALDTIALKKFVEPDSVTGNCTFEGSTIIRYKQQIPTSVCSHLYRLDAIREVRFKDVTMCEDVLFNLEVYMKDLCIRCANANLYRYTTNAGQATRKRDSKTMEKAVNGFEYLFDIAKSYQKARNSDKQLSDGIDKMIAMVFSSYISRLLCADLSSIEFRKKTKELREKEILPIQEIEKKHKIYNMICRHPSWYPIESLLYRKIFIPYILPRLSRN